MAMSSVKSDLAFLFTIITSLKYKYILHLLKEDGLNQSVLVYQFVIFIPLSYCFEETTELVVKVLFAKGPLSPLIKTGDITKEF